MRPLAPLAKPIAAPSGSLRTTIASRHPTSVATPGTGTAARCAAQSPLGSISGNRAAPPAMAVLVGDQPGAQRFIRSRLQSLIEAGAHRQPGPVQNFFAIAGQQVAPDLLGEIGGSDLFRLLPMAKLEGLSFGLRCLGLGGCSVFDHPLQDPIAASFCRLREARRAVSVWCLGEPGEERSLTEGQIIERFVEIGERRSRDTVSTRAEIDFVQVELEDALLRQRGLDAGGQQDLLDLAFDRNLVRQQHVFCDLLGDCRGTDRPAISAKPAHIGDRRAQDRNGVDPVMVVKVFVFGRQKGVDDRLRDRLYRHENPPLGCVFGEKQPVARLHSGHDRRLIMRKLLVIRQVTTEIPECDPDESTACDGQHDCAYKKKPEDLNHVACGLRPSPCQGPPDHRHTMSPRGRAFICAIGDTIPSMF